jgi:hypothetical protein
LQLFSKQLLIVTYRILKTTYRNLINRRQGQVSEKHQVGRWIRHLASLEENRSILEIGTWNGLGTSRMIVQGVSSRPDRESVEVIGLEANEKLYRKAKFNLRKFGFFQVIFGTLVSQEQLDRSELTSLEKDWLAQDIDDLKNAPFVLSRIPRRIDLLILDGGEFSTYTEFQLLKERVSKWIVLDDVNTRKCKRVLQELVAENLFLLVWSSPERNGTAVLLRK